MTPKLVNLSKSISFALRHNPAEFNLIFIDWESYDDA